VVVVVPEAGKLLSERLPPIIEHGVTFEVQLRVTGALVHTLEGPFNWTCGVGPSQEMVTCALAVRPPAYAQPSVYVTRLATVSVSDIVPDAASVPDHPSPETPPLAVHCVAPGAPQLSVTDCPIEMLSTDALNVTNAARALGITTVPVLCGSSTALRVALPVLLVVSAVEFHTAARDVKSATPLLPLGAGGLATGHDP
jgi:hypothetical protein